MALADIYDEEFNRHLMLAKSMIPKVKRRADRATCSKWISRLCALSAYDPVVKKNRNHFFKYMLTVLHKAITEVPDAHFGFPQYDDKFKPEDPTYGGKGYMSRWSADGRTYVAAKPIPGKGALVYMAVAQDPSLGWDKPSDAK